LGGVLISHFALNHHQGQAIHEKNNVGDDISFNAARGIDPKLVDGQEVVIIGVLKVNQGDIGELFAGQFVTVYLSAVEQGLGEFVGFNEAGTAEVGEFVVEVVELFVGKPFSPVFGAVEETNGPLKQPFEDDLTKAGATTEGGVGGDARPLFDDFPTEAGELVEEGFFDGLIFRHGGCWLPNGCG
jgi:hypothetical protein